MESPYSQNILEKGSISKSQYKMDSKLKIHNKHSMYIPNESSEVSGNQQNTNSYFNLNS